MATNMLSNPEIFAQHILSDRTEVPSFPRDQKAQLALQAFRYPSLLQWGVIRADL